MYIEVCSKHFLQLPGNTTSFWFWLPANLL